MTSHTPFAFVLMGTDGIRLKSAQRVLNDMTRRAFWQRLLRLLQEERRNDGTAVWRNGADGTKIKNDDRNVKNAFDVFRRLAFFDVFDHDGDVKLESIFFSSNESGTRKFVTSALPRLGLSQWQ